MKFELITKDNLLLATEIQLKIFNNVKCCAYLHYLNSFICKKDYYIVYEKGEPIGITGLYVDEFTQEEGVVWLGWFGILPEFRKKGYGQKILEETILLAKDNGFSILRLYTEKENLSACRLYNKIMDICEDYTKESVVGCIVYSKALNNEKVKSFNNKS